MRRIFLWLMLLTSGLQAQIQINEVMSDNDDIIRDPDGAYSDWIELYNFSDTVICLDEWYLSDELDERFKWQFADTCLESGKFLIVWANGANMTNSLMTNFRLSQEGEAIVLSNQDSIVDAIQYPILSDDESFGRINEGIDFAILAEPTPGASNNSGVQDYGNALLRFVPNFPWVQKDTKILVEASDSCESLRYNFEGRQEEGILTTENPSEIELSIDRSLDPYFSYFPTSSGFRPPRIVEKIPHLSVFCLDENGRDISSRHQTYVNRESRILQSKLPVLFIDTEERNLFDSEFGIMVEGNDTNYDQEGRDWERDAHVYIKWPGSDSLDVSPIGIRIHGHATRLLPQKSIKLYYRPDYESQAFDGSQLSLPYSPARMIVRSFHSDFIGNEFKDFGFRNNVVMRIIRDVEEVFPQATMPATLFINGEYWGLYALHEATDDDFIEARSGYSKDDIDLIEGPEVVYQLYRSIQHLDLEEPADRREFEKIFDWDNLLKYILIETFFGNTDWPHNNVKLWRPKGIDAPYNFVIFDMDATLKEVTSNPFSRFFSHKGLSQRFSERHNAFYQYLMSSDDFVSELKALYYEWQSSILDVDRMLDISEQLQDELSPHINAQSDRWHYPKSYRAWTRSHDEINEFLIKRRLYFHEHLLEVSPGLIYPNPNADGILVLQTENMNAFNEAEIYSLSGQMLYKTNINDGRIDIKHLLSNGMVIVKLMGPYGSAQEKVLLVKE